MASANDDAGETLSSQLPATIPRENSTLAISTTAKSSSTTLQYIEVAEDDDCASGSSSPPTHPAFFSPSKTNPKQRDASSTSLEEENVSPSALMGMDPMISSISLSGCPVAALVAQRPSSFSMKSAGAGARAGTANIVVVEDELAAFSVVGLEEDDCDWFGNCGNVKEGSLGNVDMNIVAALSSEKANGEVPVVSAQFLHTCTFRGRLDFPRLTLHSLFRISKRPRRTRQTKRANERTRRIMVEMMWTATKRTK